MRNERKLVNALLVGAVALGACSPEKNEDPLVSSRTETFPTQPRETEEIPTPTRTPTLTEAIPEPTELLPASIEELSLDLTVVERLLIQQGLEAEVKELSDGTEVVVISKEWKLEKIPSWAAIVNGPENAQINGRVITYRQERILAFSDNTRRAYMAEAGRLMKWDEGDWRGVELPEGVDEISFFDKYQGDWYGITQSDRAVVKLGAEGNWERYLRPTKIAFRRESFPDGLPKELPEEIDESKVQRLFDSQGNEVPFGYLFDVSPNGDGRPTHVFVSGYPLEVLEAGYPVEPGSAQQAYIMYFEIPLRYERQVFVAGVLSGPFIFPNLSLIPSSRNINERRGKGIQQEEIRNATLSPQAIGNQMVLAFQTKNSGDLPLTVLWNAGWDELAAKLREGEAAAVDTTFNPSFIWVDEALYR